MFDPELRGALALKEAAIKSSREGFGNFQAVLLRARAGIVLSPIHAFLHH